MFCIPYKPTKVKETFLHETHANSIQIDFSSHTWFKYFKRDLFNPN